MNTIFIVMCDEDDSIVAIYSNQEDAEAHCDVNPGLSFSEEHVEHKLSEYFQKAYAKFKAAQQE